MLIAACSSHVGQNRGVGYNQQTTFMEYVMTYIHSTRQAPATGSSRRTHRQAVTLALAAVAAVAAVAVVAVAAAAAADSLCLLRG